MKISELTQEQKGHLAWRLDHKTFIGIIGACRIARGECGDLDLVEVFRDLADRSEYSAKIHARKVMNYDPADYPPYPDRA